MTADNIIAILSAMRPPAVMDEAELQRQVADMLRNAGVGFEREAHVGKGCRVDFLLEGGLAIEVKARRRPPSALKAQLARYAGCEAVGEIALVSLYAAHVPRSVAGKSVRVLCLTQLWGVAV